MFRRADVNILIKLIFFFKINVDKFLAIVILLSLEEFFLVKPVFFFVGLLLHIPSSLVIVSLIVGIAQSSYPVLANSAAPIGNRLWNLCGLPSSVVEDHTDIMQFDLTDSGPGVTRSDRIAKAV